MEEEKNAESRLLAALAHGSVVAQGVGILVGVLVYINQRDKSRFAAFQALQAAVFQLINLILVILMWVAWTILYTLSLIPLIAMMERSPDGAPSALFWFATFSWVLPLIVMFFIALIGLWAALRVWQGNDFRYPLIGSWLEKSGLWNE